MYKNRISNSKKVNYSIDSTENIFSNFIAKQETIDNLNLLIHQILKSDKIENKHLKPIKGFLISGKPGTGKTLIARCLEKIKNITFISTCASEYVELFVGSGSKKVREIFENARNSKPAIIFIDELEAIGMKRSNNFTNYSMNIERYSALNQLLSEMDGINDNDGIIVLGATNRDDLLDSALIRPGRFDIKITIEVPDHDVRLKIYHHYLNKYGYSDEIDMELVRIISSNSVDFSGAVIENIINEAARLSYTKGFKVIQKEDLINSHNRNKSEFLKFKQFEVDY